MGIDTSFVPSPIARDPGSNTLTNGVRVIVHPVYHEDKSDPGASKFYWMYEVTIINETQQRVRLLRRHWKIIDGEGDRNEVDGLGVVGYQPSLGPGELFKYKSFSPLEYPWGTMEGSYVFEREDGSTFTVRIGRFFLVSPHV